MAVAASPPRSPLLSTTQIRCRPHDWRVDSIGSGPEILALHGTGASRHSWHGVMRALSHRFRVIALDLPGHGRTRLGNRLRSGLGPMAQDIAALIEQEGWSPKAVLGHSAGAAIALRLAQKLKGGLRVVGVNPALQPFHGLAGVMFPVAARLMAMTPGAATFLSRSMTHRDRVGPLLDSTGSALSKEDADPYLALFRSQSHVDGTLLMMAQWKLDGLMADLPGIAAPCLFLTGSNDKMVPPVSAVEAAERMTDARVLSLDGFGHLVHEEAPDLVAQHICDWVTGA